MQRRHQAISLQQAAQDSPTLAKLTDLLRDSSARLQAIEPLIPPPLRSSVKAGPIDGTAWCMLVSSTAAAAKLRQLLPDFLSRLNASGWQVTTIRLKIQSR